MNGSVSDSLSNIFQDHTLIDEVEEIVLPDGLKYMSHIEGFKNLRKITIPKELKSIGSIRDCLKLQEICFPDYTDNIEYIGTFDGDISLERCELPSASYVIYSYMFEFCSKLEKLEIPENVTSIEQCAFYGCTELKEINIPDSVGFIAKSAFTGCDKLVVSCNKGSYAQEYCEKNVIKTNIIGETEMHMHSFVCPDKVTIIAA